MALFDVLETNRDKIKGKRVEGIVLGIVTNNKDSEGLGRVKVKFPWYTDRDESQWARMATLMAGGDRGAFFLPEVGDEVLIAFDHGDIDYPYIIGSLWNGKDKPPETNSDGKNNIRKIKSRSGHELIFNDGQNNEKIEIHTKSGHKILLDDSSGNEKIEIIDKTGSNSIHIDSVQNAISISSQMKLSIKAKIIEIESSGIMNIKAGAALNIQGAIVKIN